MIRSLTATIATFLLLLATAAQAGWHHHHGYYYPMYSSAVYPSAVIGGQTLVTGQTVIAGQSVLAPQTVFGGQSVVLGQSVLNPVTSFAAPQSLVVSPSSVNASAVTPDQILTLLGLVSKLIPDRQIGGGGGGGGGGELSIDGSHGPGGNGANPNIEGRLQKLEQSMGVVLKKLKLDCDKQSSSGTTSSANTSGKTAVGSVGPKGQQFSKPFAASAVGSTDDCEEVANPGAAAEPSIADVLKSVEQMKSNIATLDASVKGKLKKLQDDAAALDELKKQLGIPAAK